MALEDDGFSSDCSFSSELYVSAHRRNMQSEHNRGTFLFFCFFLLDGESMKTNKTNNRELIEMIRKGADDERSLPVHDWLAYHQLLSFIISIKREKKRKREDKKHKSQQNLHLNRVTSLTQVYTSLWFD